MPPKQAFTTFQEASQTRGGDRLECLSRNGSTKTLRDLLEWGKGELEGLGSGEALVSVEYLFEEVLGFERFQIYLNQDEWVSEAHLKRFEMLIEERKKRIPLAHLLGRASFWNEELKVGPECLIPRPETEVLVERLIENLDLEKNKTFSFLDLGSGSGAIGIALLRTYPRARATFSDISEDALGVTKENLRRYDLMNRAKVVHSDLFSSFAGIRWDLIVSNPPYLSVEDWGGLEPEVLKDPRVALNGGRDGYDFYRRITAGAGDHLTPSGKLAFEVGAGQAEQIATLLQAERFTNIKIYNDYTGIKRVLLAEMPNRKQKAENRRQKTEGRK